MSIPVAHLAGPESEGPDALDRSVVRDRRHAVVQTHAGAARFTVEGVTAWLLGFYLVAGAVVYAWLGDGSYVERLLEPRLWQVLLYMAPLGVAAVLVYHRLTVRAARGGRVVGARAGWTAAWQAARRGPFTSARLRFATAVIFGAPLFFNAFAAWKSAIPAVHPFAHDVLFAHLDALIHGGPPHRLLAWLPLVPIDIIYFFVWGQMLLLALVVMAWLGEARVLLAFLLTWILLGTLVALIGSSAGPAYYQALTGHDTYARLIAHLATARSGEPLIAFDVQRNLWNVYSSHAIVAAGGISAFPSMHVAVPSLLAFLSWKRSRPLSVLLGAFTVVILVSSVALGWHYAVDGYASILASGLIWLLVAKLPIRTGLDRAGDRMGGIQGAV